MTNGKLWMTQFAQAIVLNDQWFLANSLDVKSLGEMKNYLDKIVKKYRLNIEYINMMTVWETVEAIKLGSDFRNIMDTELNHCLFVVDEKDNLDLLAKFKYKEDADDVHTFFKKDEPSRLFMIGTIADVIKKYGKLTEQKMHKEEQ